MTTLRTAAQQALEALEHVNRTVEVDVLLEITALRTALAESETPCPYVRGSSEGTHWCALAAQRTEPEQEPLTDEEISDLWCEVSNTDFVTADTHVFARAIERAHGIGGEA